MRYIHELKNWPEFHWSQERIAAPLADIRHRQGRLIGKMESLGFNLREEAVLKTLTEDVVKSSEIEGEMLDREQVRSSLARRLGMDMSGLPRAQRDVEGVVEMMLDATQKYNDTLTGERLFGWHAALFPTGRSGMSKIRVGKWRDDSAGRMQVVSGSIGKEKVHFEAPAANRLNKEMKLFLAWMNDRNRFFPKNPSPIDPVVVAGVAHLWFVTLHPFEDGNGRIARAIADMALARSENSSQRFYSMSSQICLERKRYYEILEATQRGDLDITGWLTWFLECLGRAFEGAESILASVLKKAQFWEAHNGDRLNSRQIKMMNLLFDGFEGKLTSSKWASLCKCSQDTASRDLEYLVVRKILVKTPGGGRSTSFSLAEDFL